mmetsp:Transcript_31708/g.73558  ORF Transcript_31708/g.73558 Transcript_31708/m.73558 type:complete len:270 (+) Transcript_31708:92-901(+)|eukprot:CAMPEP_0171065080 /NCGR_PEP_ID=MMETSP0766_2-20121228/6644_1 /TAXON_ID=439317 /ORGANISM="Gambierdiscus australes, Strain CAWD 149" /LENGTH=269 /DNA_ID=CAMNT_0011521153 /DNA_START=22 /DNA_END=831 /DNA_ORIENTATION=-
MWPTSPYQLWAMLPGPWQVANAVAFVANVVAVRSTRRLDSASATDQPLNYLTPAGYAFAIWGVIYFLEYALVCFQLLPRAKGGLLNKTSPWWCAANACQVLWCFTFRPSFNTPALLWLSAVGLSGIAACLGRAHAVIVERWGKSEGGLFWYYPITLHFAWTTAAALVNWNGYLARCTSAVTLKLAGALLSAALATTLGTSLAVNRRSALYAGTVAWALLAVGVQTLRSERLAGELGSAVSTVLGGTEALLALGLAAVMVGLGFAGRTGY